MTFEDQSRLDHYMSLVAERAVSSIGHPFAPGVDYSKLYPLLTYPLINQGDSLKDVSSGGSSLDIEREIIEFFAKLFRVQRGNFVGCVTSGEKESNLYSLYMARERHPKAMVYYSAAAHDSVPKSIRLLNMRSCLIRATPNGEMDYDDLRVSIKRHGYLSVIVIANIGTMMTEAKDDVPTIQRILQASAAESYHIHCDASLAGMYLPLLEADPTFDFMHGVDSIACSGHYFTGSPVSCGTVIFMKPQSISQTSYTTHSNSLYTTIAGSRNEFSSILLWYAIKQLGITGLQQRVMEALLLAEYTQYQLQQNGIAAWRHEKAITVVFPKPAELICQKWQLVTDQHQAHLVCMPGVSKQVIDRFIADLVSEMDQPKNCSIGNSIHA